MNKKQVNKRQRADVSTDTSFSPAGQSSSGKKQKQKQFKITDYHPRTTDTMADRAAVNELKELIENSTEKLMNEIQSLKLELINVKEENQLLKDQQRTLKEEVSDLKQKVLDNRLYNNNLEQWTRRPNVRVFGVKDINPKESAEETEKKFIDVLKIMGLENLRQGIDIAHRVGSFKPGKSRPIIVKMHGRKDKVEIMKNKKALKGSGIGVSEDLTIFNAKLYDRCRRDENFNQIWTRNGTIYVRDKSNHVRKIEHSYYQNQFIFNTEMNQRKHNAAKLNDTTTLNSDLLTPPLWSTPRYNNNENTYRNAPIHDDLHDPLI